MLKLKLFVCLLSLLGIVRTQNQDSALDALGDRLFSSTCPEESQYTEWTKCVWPQAELHRMVESFLKSAHEKQCKIPPKPMIREASSEIRKYNVSLHPLYRKIPQAHCGMCSRKAKCCTTARSFLMQSFKSEPCDQQTSPCTFPQLTNELLAELRPWYPGLTFNGDRCNFTQFTSENLRSLRAQKAWKAVKPLLCQLLGTSEPTLNCVSVGNECKCCCYQYVYQNGECVQRSELSPTGC